MVTSQAVARAPQDFLLLVTLPDGREEEHTLDGREITVGRDPANRIRIPHHFVSQFHAKFVRTGESWMLVDLGSVNKTRVGGHAILQKTLMGGEEIEFAGVKCRILAPTPEHSGCIAGAGPVSDPARAGPPVPRIYLSVGVIVLFTLVTALAHEVCR